MIRWGLAAATLALVGVLIMQWRHWPPLPPAASEQAGTAATDGSGQPAAEPAVELAPPESKDSYASVAERPLFRPQRKPPDPPSAEPPPEPVPEEAGSLDGVDLSAVLIAPGLTLAWIRDPSTPELKRLRLGDEHAGWLVKDILADRLVLERQGATNQLLLRDFSAGQTVPPAVPPPAAPRPATRPNAVGRPNVSRPNAAIPQRPQQPPQRASQNARTPRPDQRVTPPTPSQPRPNGPRPPSMQPR